MQRHLLAVALLALIPMRAGPAPRKPARQRIEPVRVVRQRVLYLGHEYFRPSQFLQGTRRDTIAAWGFRILEWPLDSARFQEVVPEDARFRYANGSAVADLDGDGEQELILGRYERQNWKGHEIFWYERPAGQARWTPHLIGTIEAPNRRAPHDMAWYAAKTSGGGAFCGVLVSVDSDDMYLFEKPEDPRQPWIRHHLGHSPDPPQSGMRVADLNGDGRPDIITGMHWIEGPADPSQGPWRFHRFGTWDREKKPWGGMAKHAVGDFDGDGELELAVSEAEIPEARLAIFKRNPNDVTALWTPHLLDTGLYGPHTLESVDLDEDGRLDLIVGELDVCGYNAPATPSPHIYAYLNRGALRFVRNGLSTGWGVHEAKVALKRFEGRILLYGNTTTQPFFEGAVTHLSTWTLGTVKEN